MNKDTSDTINWHSCHRDILFICWTFKCR